MKFLFNKERKNTGEGESFTLDILPESTTPAPEEQVEVKYMGIDWTRLATDMAATPSYSYTSIKDELKEYDRNAREYRASQDFKDQYLQDFSPTGYSGLERFYGVLGIITFEQLADHVDALIYHANEFNDGRVLEIDVDNVRIKSITDDEEGLTFWLERKVISVVKPNNIRYGSNATTSAQTRVDTVLQQFRVVESDSGQCDLIIGLGENYELKHITGILFRLIGVARGNAGDYW